MTQKIILIFTLLLLLTSACTLITPPQAAAPTLQPTAAVLAQLPAAAQTPITNTLTISPTATAEQTPTPAPPTPTPTPIIIPALNITSPQSNTAAQLNTAVTVSGRGTAPEGHTIEIALISLDNQLITAAQTALNELNTWQVDLIPPITIAGQATLIATLFSAEGELLANDTTTVVLTPTTNDERYLLLERPGVNTTAVAGYSLFFDGLAERPTDFLVEIALKNGPNCQQTLAQQNYAMRGSGYWQAFFPIPDSAEGAACAVIFFGDVGTDGRREIQLPVSILPRTDPNAYGLFLAYPPNNSNANGGQRINLYGTAYNAPNNQVIITLTLPDGTLAASEIATVERSGYWEHSLLLPVDVTGETLLSTVIGRDGEILAEQAVFLTLLDE